MGLGKPFKYFLKIFEWFRVQGVKYSAKCCLAGFPSISSLLLGVEGKVAFKAGT